MEEERAVGEKGTDMNLPETLLNWIYPRHCPFCGRILKDQSSLICRECAEEIRPVGEPRCRKCGKPLEQQEQEYCADCRKQPHYYEEGIGIFFYDKKMKDSLMKYKYGGRQEYSRFYSHACAVCGEAYIRRWGIQGIIPVPMHKKKERMWGFNQAALLAEQIGQSLKIPVYESCLKKTAETAAQKTLGARERRRNLQGAFRGTEGNWGLERVLLVDDVYTTGSTIDAAAEEILRHGVKSVYFLTVFIGKGF